MKHLNKIVAALAVATALAPVQAGAEDVPFGGTISDTCTITVGSAGVLGTNATFDTIGSQQTGGSAGQATVYTNNSTLSLVASAPTGWSARPTGADDNATFSSSMSASGATAFSNIAHGNPQTLGHGVTAVDVDMQAVHGSGVFTAGLYSSLVTLTCS